MARRALDFLAFALFCAILQLCSPCRLQAMGEQSALSPLAEKLIEHQETLARCKASGRLPSPHTTLEIFDMCLENIEGDDLAARALVIMLLDTILTAKKHSPGHFAHNKDIQDRIHRHMGPLTHLIFDHFRTHPSHRAATHTEHRVLQAAISLLHTLSIVATQALVTGQHHQCIKQFVADAAFRETACPYLTMLTNICDNLRSAELEIDGATGAQTGSLLENACAFCQGVDAELKRSFPCSQEHRVHPQCLKQAIRRNLLCPTCATINLSMYLEKAFLPHSEEILAQRMTTALELAEGNKQFSRILIPTLQQLLEQHPDEDRIYQLIPTALNLLCLPLCGTPGVDLVRSQLNILPSLLLYASHREAQALQSAIRQTLGVIIKYALSPNCNPHVAPEILSHLVINVLPQLAEAENNVWVVVFHEVLSQNAELIIKRITELLPPAEGIAEALPPIEQLLLVVGAMYKLMEKHLLRGPQHEALFRKICALLMEGNAWENPHRAGLAGHAVLTILRHNRYLESDEQLAPILHTTVGALRTNLFSQATSRQALALPLLSLLVRTCPAHLQELDINEIIPRTIYLLEQNGHYKTDGIAREDAQHLLYKLVKHMRSRIAPENFAAIVHVCGRGRRFSRPLTKLYSLLSLRSNIATPPPITPLQASPSKLSLPILDPAEDYS